MRTFDSDTAILLAAHGSRQQAALIAAEEIRARLEAELQHPVALGFLELATPDIATRLNALADAGAKRILVQPLMLSASGHVANDIPLILRQFSVERQDTRILYGEPFSDDPAIAQIAQERIEAALKDLDKGSQAALLTVGRNAEDPKTASLAQWLNEELTGRFGFRCSATGFAGSASPTIEEAIEDLAARCPGQPVIVQPYLLFPGYISSQIAMAVRAATARLGTEVRLADPLGAHSALIHLLADRINSLQFATGSAIIAP